MLGREGTDVNKSDSDGDTALHEAAGVGHIEIVRALLEAGAGADVRKLDKYDDSPLSNACKGKHFEVFRALVEAGGDVNKLDSGGFTALHHASEYGLTEGVRYLCVERGADVNKSTTGWGNTPLTLASRNGNVEAVRVLLEAGADVNKRDSEGRTPLYIALVAEFWYPEQRYQDKAKVAALLREAGAQEPA